MVRSLSLLITFIYILLILSTEYNSFLVFDISLLNIIERISLFSQSLVQWLQLLSIVGVKSIVRTQLRDRHSSLNVVIDVTILEAFLEISLRDLLFVLSQKGNKGINHNLRIISGLETVLDDWWLFNWSCWKINFTFFGIDYSEISKLLNEIILIINEVSDSWVKIFDKSIQIIRILLIILFYLSFMTSIISCINSVLDLSSFINNSLGLSLLVHYEIDQERC